MQSICCMTVAQGRNLLGLIRVILRADQCGPVCLQEDSVFDIIPGDVVSSNILAAAAALTQVILKAQTRAL